VAYIVRGEQPLNGVDITGQILELLSREWRLPKRRSRNNRLNGRPRLLRLLLLLGGRRLNRRLQTGQILQDTIDVLVVGKKITTVDTSQ